MAKKGLFLVTALILLVALIPNVLGGEYHVEWQLYDDFQGNNQGDPPNASIWQNDTSIAGCFILEAGGGINALRSQDGAGQEIVCRLKNRSMSPTNFNFTTLVKSFGAGNYMDFYFGNGVWNQGLIVRYRPNSLIMLAGSARGEVTSVPDPKTDYRELNVQHYDGRTEVWIDGTKYLDNTTYNTYMDVPHFLNFNPDVDNMSMKFVNITRVVGNCSDDLQNGDETGVDCGGAVCNVCVNPSVDSTNITEYNAVNKEFTIGFNVTDMIDDFTCAIINNSQLTCNSYTFDANSTKGNLSCTPPADTEFNESIWVQCNGTGGISQYKDINSTVENLFIDTVSPSIIFHYPAEGGTTIYENSTPLTFDINIIDNNTYAFEINCTSGRPMEAGSTTLFNYTEVDIARANYSYDNTTYLTYQGLVQCLINASDDHTATEFTANTGWNNKYWLFGLLEKDVTKLTTLEGYVGDLDFTIEKTGVPSLDAEIKHKTDRYSLNITFDNPLRQEVTVPVKIECPYTASKRSTADKYKEHWVCADGITGYWIDGNTLGDEEVTSSYNAQTKEITYEYTTTGNNIVMDSIGGLNYVSQFVNFTSVYNMSLEFYGFNNWNNSPIDVFNVTIYNSTWTENYTTTTGKINISVGNGTYTLKQEAFNYYFGNISTSISNLGSKKYNTSFWQSRIDLTVKYQYNNGLATGVQIVVNDSVTTNTSTLSTGILSYYTNAQYYTADIGNSYLTSYNETSFETAVGNISAVTLYTNPFTNLTYTLYDAETKVPIASGSSFTVYLYNTETTNSYTNITTVNWGRFTNLTAGNYRLTVNPASTDFESIIVYTNLTNTTPESNISLYLLNTSKYASKQVTLHVQDEVNDNLENAEINIYSQDQTTGVFNLVYNKYTNINGQVIAYLITNTEWYKFTIYYQGTKCYETSNPFTITSLDDDIYFTCVLGNNYLEIRDTLNNITADLGFSNSTNVTGTYSFEATSTGIAEVCLDVYRVNNRNSSTQIQLSCSNTTSTVLTVNVDASSFSDDVTFLGIGSVRPHSINITEYKQLYFTFKIETVPDFGLTGLLIVFLAMIMVYMVFIKIPQVAVLASGGTFFLLSFTPLLKITAFGNNSSVVGIGVFVMSIVISLIISKRSGE